MVSLASGGHGACLMWSKQIFDTTITCLFILIFQFLFIFEKVEKINVWVRNPQQD